MFVANDECEIKLSLSTTLRHIVGSYYSLFAHVLFVVLHFCCWPNDDNYFSEIHVFVVDPVGARCGFRLDPRVKCLGTIRSFEALTPVDGDT